ncbi:MAG: DUF2505 domain-containing protein [Myxococcales bacterium]|nr:DUF2505 domain-containing protein [Myxococcales bacterium]
MRSTIRHTFNTDIDTFWNRIFFDRVFNESLFRDHLHFTRYEIVELERSDDGSVRRRVECVPPAEIPGPLKKVLGESAGYTEVGRFDPSRRRFEVEVIPNVAADKIKSRVAIWAEPRGDKQIERVVEMDTTVKIFGVGKMAEGFIDKQARQSYQTAADFTNRWIADKGL